MLCAVASDSCRGRQRGGSRISRRRRPRLVFRSHPAGREIPRRLRISPLSCLEAAAGPETASPRYHRLVLWRRYRRRAAAFLAPSPHNAVDVILASVWYVPHYTVVHRKSKLIFIRNFVKRQRILILLLLLYWEMSVTPSTLKRFSQFFHWRTQRRNCN